MKKDIEDSNFGRELLDKSKTEIGVIDINSGKFEKVCSFSNKEESTYQQIGKYLYLSTDENNQIKKIDLDTKKESILAKTKENVLWRNTVMHFFAWNGEIWVHALLI